MKASSRPTLIAFGGLPGVGKTAIARELAGQIAATYLRIDTIEEALRQSGRCSQPAADAGYCVAYSVAEENLRIGNTVVTDSVNPLPVTRDAWLKVAKQARVPLLEVEIKCSDLTEHRRRLENRATDVPTLHFLTWEEVASREYHTWNRPHLVIDTFLHSTEESVRLIRERLEEIATPKGNG